jgi:hypothetical protein
MTGSVPLNVGIDIRHRTDVARTINRSEVFRRRGRPLAAGGRLAVTLLEDPSCDRSNRRLRSHVRGLCPGETVREGTDARRHYRRDWFGRGPRRRRRQGRSDNASTPGCSRGRPRLGHSAGGSARAARAETPEAGRATGIVPSAKGHVERGPFDAVMEQTLDASQSAIRGQPHVGFPFHVTTAATTSWLGPLGPGFLGTVDENSRRYCRFVSARWSLKRVEGFRTIADRTSRLGRMNSAHMPATMRSAQWRLGERFRDRLKISSCCLTSRDSATTARAPPGPASRATVARRWRNRTTSSRMCTILTSWRSPRNAKEIGIRHAQPSRCIRLRVTHVTHAARVITRNSQLKTSLIALRVSVAPFLCPTVPSVTSVRAPSTPACCQINVIVAVAVEGGAAGSATSMASSVRAYGPLGKYSFTV